MMMRRTSLPVVAAAVLLGGCAPVIHIVKPEAANPYDPVPQLVVNFTSSFNPGYPWYVDMDGTNITGFTPAPAPGVTSTAPLAFPVYSSHTIHAQGTCGTFCSYPSESVTFRPPELFYNSTTGSTTTALKQTVESTEYIGIGDYSSVPVTIDVVETTVPKRVRLANVGGPLQPPGGKITLTIAPGDTKTNFQIRGDVLGGYTLRFTTPGTPGGGGNGTVIP